MNKLSWTTEKRKVSELIPAEYNPRQMTAIQAKELRKSLDRFGLVEIPAVDQDGTILAGHQRLTMLKEMGQGEEEIDVRVPNRKLTEKEAMEYNLRSNKNTGEWDMDKLFAMPEGLLEEVGFDKREIQKLIDGHTEVVEDDYNDEEGLQKPVRCEKGEIWQLGSHRLMCGDSTVKEDVERLMDGKKADMVFTDPPYGVDYSGGIQFTKDGVKKDQRDRLEADESAEIYLQAIPMMAEFCDGPIYTWFADTKARQLYEAIELVGGKIHAMIVWVKNGGYGAINACYKQKHEPCLFWKVGAKLRWTGISTECTVWEIDKDGKNKFHPTQKPIELCARALKNHDARLCLDLFLGSGSTLIACEQTGRTCYGLEIDPKYATVIIDRWEKLTGKQAVKL